MAAPPLKQIAELHHAYSPEMFAPQRHFVEHPVTPGPQACLIEVQQPNHRLQIVDALTIVPSQVRHTIGNPNPLYACWLGVIKNFYSADVKMLSTCAGTAALALKTEFDPPFLPPKQRLLAHAAELVVNAWNSGTTSSQPPVAQRLWDDLKQGIAEADCWYPQHRVVDVARRTCEDQWRILMAWESWEKAKLSWTQRAAAHQANFPARAHQAKMRGRTTKVSNSADAFEKRCRHMGLHKGAIAGYKRAPSFRLPVFVY